MEDCDGQHQAEEEKEDEEAQVSTLNMLATGELTCFSRLFFQAEETETSMSLLAARKTCN
jgi:hypothetical protein